MDEPPLGNLHSIWSLITTADFKKRKSGKGKRGKAVNYKKGFASKEKNPKPFLSIKLFFKF